MTIDKIIRSHKRPKIGLCIRFCCKKFSFFFLCKYQISTFNRLPPATHVRYITQRLSSTFNKCVNCIHEVSVDVLHDLHTIRDIQPARRYFQPY